MPCQSVPFSNIPDPRACATSHIRRNGPLRPSEFDGGPAVEKLMSAEDVAEFLGVPINTLYQWHHKGTGPTCFRVGRFLRYAPADVRNWLSEQSGASHGHR